MAATVTLQPPSALLPVGTTTFSQSSLSAAYSTVTLTLPRNAGWADSAGVEILELLVDVSMDGGVTWTRGEGFGVSGGTVSSTDKNGQPFTITTHTTTRSLPNFDDNPESGTFGQRLACTVRGRLVNHTGGALTALSVSIACN